MELGREHIEYSKIIGTLDGNDVVEMATTGGLHLITVSKGGKPETLGLGPHRAIARFIARKKFPKIKISDLAKADHIDEVFFLHMVPEFEELTRLFNEVR